MKNYYTKLTTAGLMIMVLVSAGLLLTGCSVLDALKKQMPGQTTSEETMPYSTDDQQPADEEMVYPETQDYGVMDDTSDDPADTIDQALQNLDTLPTEVMINEQ